jgi:hypothetical protein
METSLKVIKQQLQVVLKNLEWKSEQNTNGTIKLSGPTSGQL